MSIPEAILRVLEKIPAEAYDGVGRTLTHLLNGDSAAAAREAELTAETIAAKKLIDAAYDAGKRPNTGT